MSNISGFDYRSQSKVSKSKLEWRKEARGIVQLGGQRRMVEGETFLTVPVEEDLGAPFGKRTKQVLAVEIYGNVPL
jgi:hypothetical protein